MKSRRAIPVALLLVFLGMAFATGARAAEPDRVRLSHSCVVSPDGRARSLSSESLVPRARAALADTNQLRVTFDSADPWTPSELGRLQTYVTAFLPLLEQVCGPPSGSDLIDVIKDASLYDQGLDGTYTPGEHAIRLYRPDPVTLCHELAHAFHGDDVVYWDAFEEGMAVAASALVLQKLAGYPHVEHFGGPNDVVYELLNQPAISPHRGFFWGGMPTVGIRYDLAGYVWRKAAIEHPGFLAEFNRRYYERLAMSDTLRGSIDGLLAIAAEAAPDMEGMPFRAWADRQYVLGTNPQLGVQLYPFAYSPRTALFFRHSDGYEEPLIDEEVGWKATDADGLSAGAGTLLTDFLGMSFLYPYVSAWSLGALRVDLETETPYGSQTSEVLRPLLPGKGFFGVVRGGREGSVTITALDRPLPSETVPVRWGAFEAPTWKAWAGRFELVYTDPEGRRAARTVTKDSSSYLAILDAPAGPLPVTSAVLLARPSIATAGCRFTLSQPLSGPGHVTLYAMNGKILRVLAIPGGARAVDWDGLGADGLFASAGVYVARLIAPGVDARTRVVVTH